MICLMTGIILVLAAVLDLKTGKIPNWLTAAGIVPGLAYRIWSGGITAESVSGIWHMLLPAAMLWLLFRMHALGAGDVKLFAAVACMSGQSVFISVFLFSFLAAAIYACFKLAVRKELVPCLFRFSQYIRDSAAAKQFMPYPIGDRLSMHFAAAILAGYFITMGVMGCSN